MSTLAPGSSVQSWSMIGVRVSMTARAPSASPAMTRTWARPSGVFAVGSFSFGNSWYRGAIILSLAGRFTQIWKPCMRPPFSRMRLDGISECTTPRPAVIHCTSPGPILPRWPAESLCSISPSSMYVTVSKPRCGWSGAPIASPGPYSLGPISSSRRNGSICTISCDGNGLRTVKPPPSVWRWAVRVRTTWRKSVILARVTLPLAASPRRTLRILK